MGTGIIRVRDPPGIDYEAFQQFIFQVKARDQGTPSYTATTTVTITVTDVNDNNPIFNPAFYDTEVSIRS